MKKITVVLLAALSMASAKHCDFIGKKQGEIIAKNSPLDSLCTEFGKAYKDAKASSDDKGGADKVAQAFQDEASACKDSACIGNSFEKALGGFGNASREISTETNKSSYSWWQILLFIGAVLAPFAFKRVVNSFHDYNPIHISNILIMSTGIFLAFYLNSKFHNYGTFFMLTLPILSIIAILFKDFNKAPFWIVLLSSFFSIWAIFSFYILLIIAFMLFMFILMMSVLISSLRSQLNQPGILIKVFFQNGSSQTFWLPLAK